MLFIFLTPFQQIPLPRVFISLTAFQPCLIFVVSALLLLEKYTSTEKTACFDAILSALSVGKIGLLQLKRTREINVCEFRRCFSPFVLHEEK